MTKCNVAKTLNITSTVNISAWVTYLLIDFQQQQWLFHDENNNSHDPTLLMAEITYCDSSQDYATSKVKRNCFFLLQITKLIHKQYNAALPNLVQAANLLLHPYSVCHDQ